MFVLIWATLLLSVIDSNADTDTSVEGRQQCNNGFCITLKEGEITAEAGLCVVIPCSFTTGSGLTPEHIVWFKCEPQKKCSDSDIIFHSNPYNKKVQPDFKRRTSLLEPDLNRRNCSIIINDLIESDSGSYQLRVNGFRYKWGGSSWYTATEGFTYSPKAAVSVKDLMQRPTVMIPPLTEGQQTTLSCTAPGLCSGSDPKITWIWGGTGLNNSHVTGNITDFQIESLTAIRQRHSSTLTFNPSAEHHGTTVTCQVSFTGDTTTEETVTLNVTYVKEVKITGNVTVKEGETLNLTCSVESFPPSLIVWTKLFDKNLQNGTETILQNSTLTDLQNDTDTYLQKDSGMSTLSISNMTVEDSGVYICTAKHLNKTLMEQVDVKVIYMKNLAITGNTTVEEGETLNLTCSIESFPLSCITWTKLGSKTNLLSESSTDLQNITGSATLVIHNVTAEHSGQYICTAQHPDKTVTINADVTVTLFPKIINSGCKVLSEVLTCTCISHGLPLPTIKWPLLKNHSEYSVTTAVSNHTVNSTLTVKDHSNTVAECVSSNENGEVKQNLTVDIEESRQGETSKEVLKIVSMPEVIIAFLTGFLLSAFICCLAIKCHRRKQKSSGNLDGTLEMVTSQDDPLISPGQAEEYDQTYYQEGVEEGEDVAAEKPTVDVDGGPKDVEYASIDFSVLKRKSLRDAANQREATATEYAEIKKRVKEERDGSSGKVGDVLEGKEEEEEEMTGGNEENKHFVPDEEDGEDMAVYSNVKDIMEEI